MTRVTNWAWVIVLAGAVGWMGLPVGLTPAVLAQEAETQNAASAVHDLARDSVDTLWYGLYVQGHKVGHAHVVTQIRGEGEDRTFTESAKVVMSLKSLGQDVTLRMSADAGFGLSGAFALRRNRVSQESAAGTEIVEVVATADGYEARITQAGETRTETVEGIEFGFRDNYALALWVRSGPAEAATLEYRSFDTDSLKIEAARARVVSVRDLIVDGVSTKVFEILNTDEEGSESSFTMDAGGRVLSFEFGGMVTARLEPEDVATDPAQVVDLFVNNTVRADGLIGSPPTVKRLRIGLDPERAALLVTAPGQTVTKIDDGSYVLEITAGAGVVVKATADEIRDALEADVDYPAQHDKVVALARKAVGDAKSPREKVERLVAFVSEYVEDDMVADQASVLDVIARKTGDCTEHTELMTVLCRAVGVPARAVSGLMYMGDKIGVFGGHAWTEVVLDGNWTAVDATWNQVVVDATHIRFPIVPSKKMRATTGFGGTTLKILEVEKAETAPPESDPPR